MTRDVTEAEIQIAIRLGSLATRGGGDYLYVRLLGDGRELHLLRWGGGGVQLSVGFADGFYTDSWIYDNLTYFAGWRAAIGWDGEGEPEGWYRHVQSGRRRPDGDPGKEFVRQ
jgi:hypothetical protein